MKACQSLVEDAGLKPTPEELDKQFAPALKFAKCMREHGIDMPDPQRDGDGIKMTIGGPGSSIDPTRMDAAQKACAKDAPFGDGPPPELARPRRGRRQPGRPGRPMRRALIGGALVDDRRRGRCRRVDAARAGHAGDGRGDGRAARDRAGRAPHAGREGRSRRDARRSTTRSRCSPAARASSPGCRRRRPC